MASTLRVWVCGLLCALVFAACAVPVSAQADPTGTENETKLDAQPENDRFAEQTNALNAATDKDTRRKAIDGVMARAAELKIEPEPLVAVLKNRQPDVLYAELLAYLKENAEIRHYAFLPLLISTAHDAGDNARITRDIVLGYNADTVIAAMQAMLKSDDLPSALAAAAFARERVGGLKGRARVIPVLVLAVSSSNSDLKATAARSLRELAMLDLGDDAAKWRDWLGQKSEESLVEEIGTRLVEALARSEAARKKLEDQLVEVTLRQMVAEKENLASLLKYLRDSEFLQVRERAAELLGELLARHPADAIAKPAVDALGAILVDPAREESLRIICARSLAELPAAAFPYIDKAFELNGLSPSLKLELVHGLKGAQAAPRLAELLKREIDTMDAASSNLLGELITQAQSVIEPATSAEARAAVLAEFSRLLLAIEVKFRAELPIGERDRFATLAQATSSCLIHVARVRATDISDCVDALLDVAAGMNSRAPAASSSALTALREALGVKSARDALVARMSADPFAAKLRALHDKVALEPNGQSLHVVVLGLYGAIGAAPADLLDALLADLLARAQAAPDDLTDGASSTLRRAIRRLLARTRKSPEEQSALVKTLLAQPFGSNDALDVLRALPSPRAPVVVMSLQDLATNEPERAGEFVRTLEATLSSDPKESANLKSLKENAEYAAFATDLFKSVKANLRQTP